jgi:hypothetical protein
MKHPDPPSDRDIQEAFRALDGTIPDGHLDDFSSRVLARLDEPEVSGMDSRELARGSGLSRPGEAALGAAAAPTEANVTPQREENSGLHEIKALASTTRRRISQRVSSEAEKEESLLVGASSGSFRAAAALPDPAAAAEPASVRIGRPVMVRPASEVDRRPMPARSSSVPFWVLGGVATAAAAAAVAVFVFGVGREKADQELASSPSKGDVVARATGTQEPASEGALAADDPASGDMKFAQPPPTDPAAAAPGAAPAASATSSPTVAVLAEPEKKAEDRGGDEGGAKGGGGLVGRSGDGKDSAADKNDPARERRDASKESEKESKKAKPQQGKGAAGEGGQDLNDVLDEVTGGIKSPAAPVEQEGPKKPSKKGLDRSDVAKAMGAVRSQVMRCRDKEQFEGTVTVKFHVAPSGAVTSAEATGGKAGSSTGACVAAAVKKAKFPPFDGASTSFTYPFLLAE